MVVEDRAAPKDESAVTSTLDVTDALDVPGPICQTTQVLKGRMLEILRSENAVKLRPILHHSTLYKKSWNLAHIRASRNAASSTAQRCKNGTQLLNKTYMNDSSQDSRKPDDTDESLEKRRAWAEEKNRELREQIEKDESEGVNVAEKYACTIAASNYDLSPRDTK
ncbi:hypothetical protein BDZ45DRAFT_756164 [Acephala macrosclerotiorum]|nr:hypothetical protein BDZ45DRAFT_756164 [Acephala macrosclerotiorum]